MTLELLEDYLNDNTSGRKCYIHNYSMDNYNVYIHYRYSYPDDKTTYQDEISVGLLELMAWIYFNNKQ